MPKLSSRRWNTTRNSIQSNLRQVIFTLFSRKQFKKSINFESANKKCPMNQHFKTHFACFQIFFSKIFFTVFTINTKLFYQKIAFIFVRGYVFVVLLCATLCFFHTSLTHLLTFVIIHVMICIIIAQQQSVSVVRCCE